MTSSDNTFSTTGGNYSLQSRLSEVRSKLSDINKKVNELEYNIVFLLARPDLVNYSSGEDNNHQEMGSGYADAQNQVTNNSAYYRWEPTFITNPSELHNQIADYMGPKYDLLINQKELVEAIDTEKKKVPHGSDNESMYYKS